MQGRGVVRIRWKYLEGESIVVCRYHSTVWEFIREYPAVAEEFDYVYKRRKLKVNLGKRKVMVCGRTVRGKCLNLSLNGEIKEKRILLCI